MIADGYMRREEFDQSLNHLVSYYQSNPTSTNLEFFKTRILKNISGSLGKQVRQGNYMKALRSMVSTQHLAETSGSNRCAVFRGQRIRTSRSFFRSGTHLHVDAESA